jgi:Ca2+-binding EF-hand superfamily protein
MAEVNAQIDEHFARMDANGDGSVDAEERQAMHAQMRERHGERGGRRGAGGHGMLGRADTNEDGQISRAEFDARSGEHFARLDTDSDGVISAEERQAMREHRSERRGRRGHRGQGDMMARMDANSDGVITRGEIGAHAVERFQRADADSDGIVTAAERQAAHEAMREQRRERRENRENQGS